MLEPRRPRLRRIPMMRVLVRTAAPLVVLMVMAGCGSTGPTTGPTNGSTTSGPEGSSTVGSCSVGSPRVTAARTVATVDLDGNGTPDVVKLTASDADCPDLLFAKQGRGYVSAQLPAGEPPVAGAFAVKVPGRRGALLVTRQEHPRGGFQLRLYGVGIGGLAELQVDKRPLVPFVALDVQEHPLSIDCGAGGVVLTEAVAHEPHGVAFAWDVKRTSYAVHGNAVTAGPTQEVADNVLPRQFAATYPELLQHTAFASCRTR